MLVPLANWHNPQKRRLEAIRSAHERDEAALLELLQAYLVLKGRKRATLSPKTLETYQLGVRDFLAWAWPPDSPAPKIHILKATADDLDLWITQLQAKGGHLEKNARPLKPASIATYLAGVRSLYKAFEWAEASSLPSGVISPRDPTPREERRPALPLDLYRQLLAHLGGSEAEVVRDRVLVRLLGQAGLRISEVLHLRISDVLLKERLIEVLGKGGKKRSVPLAKELARDLSEWLKLRAAFAQCENVIINLGAKNAGRSMTPQNARLILRKHYDALGFPARYSGAHMLRHTAGTRFYKASKDLHVTARLLGHSNLNTSAIYAKMDLEGLYEVVDKLDE